jgi:hypothetical protein
MNCILIVLMLLAAFTIGYHTRQPAIYYEDDAYSYDGPANSKL